MNENLDLSLTLKDCPKCTKLYCTFLGDVTIQCIKEDRIIIKTDYNSYSLLKDGTFNPEGECVIFPSREQRDWSKFERFWDKPKEYPKTYGECKRIMGVELWNPLWCEDTTKYEEQTEDLIDSLIRLKVCRDAYWKIAGEEMGLGKPWKPDWKNSEEKRYCIVNIEGDINLPEKILTKWILKVTNKILVFPTIEMRDAFYDNFKALIEICKELL